jgi:hypothetical protein
MKFESHLKNFFMEKFLANALVGQWQGQCKTTLYPFQLICATVKGNLERPLEVSCLPAQEVEAALEARLISTAVGPGASAVTSQSTASSRSQCFKNLFFSVHTRKLTERERASWPVCSSA